MKQRKVLNVLRRDMARSRIVFNEIELSLPHRNNELLCLKLEMDVWKKSERKRI